MPQSFIAIFPDIGKGGAERVVANISNYLANTENYDVTLISLGHEHDYGFLNLAPGIKVIHFPRKSRFDFSAFQDIAGIIQKSNVEYIFCVDFFAQLYTALLRSKLKLTFKILVNLHITIPKKLTDFPISFWAGRMLKKKDMVLFISKNQEKYVSSRFLKFSAAQKRIIYNGIDTNTFTIANSQEKEEFKKELLGLDKADKVIIKVAGMRPEKDHVSAIKALKHYHNTYTNKVYLVFVGDGPAETMAYLRDLTEQEGLTKYILFIGFNNNVQQYVACADVFTLTSHSVETFSLAALEAMACGIPAVLTNIGGANEMIVPGVNGYLTQPRQPANMAAAWHKALSDNLNAQTIRNMVVADFDIMKMNKTYSELFKNIS